MAVVRKALVAAFLLSLFALPTAHRVAAAASCDRGPLDSPSSARSGLDVPASSFGIFCDHGMPTWSIGNVAAPTLDHKSLRVSLNGGEPYSGVHAYRTFVAEPNAQSFVLDLKFQFHPATTCNNQTAPSAVQALEFTDSKWSGGKRWETAVQYRNVGNGAPGWRYWNPHASGDPWVALPITQCLTGDSWHRLRLTSTIIAGNVRYRQLAIDGVAYPLNIAVAPADAPGWPDSLGIAAQLDANSAATPFDLYLDQISFTR